jgi:hypothetical protein
VGGQPVAVARVDQQPRRCIDFGGDLRLLVRGLRGSRERDREQRGEGREQRRDDRRAPQ